MRKHSKRLVEDPTLPRSQLKMQSSDLESCCIIINPMNIKLLPNYLNLLDRSRSVT